MRVWLASIPIRGKLMLLASLASATALVIAAIIISVMDYRQGRYALFHRLQTQADVVAIGTAAAVAFDDEAAADRALDALAADHAIVQAVVFRSDGSRLAERQFDFAFNCILNSDLHSDECSLQSVYGTGRRQLHKPCDSIRHHG